MLPPHHRRSLLWKAAFRDGCPEALRELSPIYSALDRRTLAIHEAGHVVIAQWLGAHFVRAAIWQTGRDLRDGKTWAGNTETMLLKPNRAHQRMIAVAGSVAELCWGRQDVSHDFWEDPDQMSPTDWEMAGCKPGEVNRPLITAIYKVADLLHWETGPLWNQLLAVARSLILLSRGQKMGDQ
jgi:hypothetical protein